MHLAYEKLSTLALLHARTIHSVIYESQNDYIDNDMEGNGKYFSLNSVATQIWELLEVPLTVESLCEKLTEEYEISAQQCRIEVEDYLSKMQELDLVHKVT